MPHDLGHFIKSGEIMVENKTILSHDIFTHTYNGLYYINSGWLSHVLMGFCERMGGLKLLIFLKTVFLLFTIGIIYHYYLEDDKTL